MIEFDDGSREVIGACIEVHRHLGPGLLESAYEECLAVELAERGLPFERQVPLAVSYKGRSLREGYRLDFVIDRRIVLELKAVEHLLPVHEAQLLTYLRLSGFRIGLLINFHAEVVRRAIRRIIL